MVYAENLEDYKFHVTHYLRRSKVKKEIIRGMQNHEKIYNDWAKTAVSVRRLAPQNLRRNKYSLEYLFREGATDQSKEYVAKFIEGIEQTVDKLKLGQF